MESIVTIASAIGALCGLLVLLYRHYLSPRAKLRRKAVTDGHKAVEEGSVSGITSAFDKLRRKILPVLLLILLASCSTKTILHPIENTDIVFLQKGQSFEAPKNGYFISDFYLKEVMSSKIR